MKAKLLDSTLLIDLRREFRKDGGLVTEWFSRQKGPFRLNAVAVGEFLEGERDVSAVLRWLRPFGLPELAIAKRTESRMARIQRQRRQARLGENDAWMAASAMEHDLHLLTVDRGFAGVARLGLVHVSGDLEHGAGGLGA